MSLFRRLDKLEKRTRSKYHVGLFVENTPMDDAKSKSIYAGITIPPENIIRIRFRTVHD